MIRVIAESLFSFLYSNKELAIKAGNHEMLHRISMCQCVGKVSAKCQLWLV